MHHRLISVLAAASTAATHHASAQDLPGRNLDMNVRVRAVTTSHDTSTISFSLRSGTTSSEALASFSVRAPVVPIVVTPPNSDWRTSKMSHNLSMSVWTSLLGIAHGDTTPWLTYQAVGLPGIVQAWYRGDSMITVVADDSTAVVPNYNSLTDLSRTVQTVGIEAGPTSGWIVGHTLFNRLHTLVDSSCTLGWITNSGFCHVLDTLQTPSTFVALVDSARSVITVQINDVAYRMLRANANYILTFVDTSTVTLKYVCGNKYRVRNYSFATFPATWATTGDVHTGSVSTIGRWVEANPYIEQDFESPGTTMQLYYNGVLLRTVTNGATSCF